jgi:Glycosyltransferase family 87/WD40-like Beta Propeller Repeat
MVPLSYFDPLTAKRLWIVINLLLLLVIVQLLSRTTRLSKKHILILILLAALPLRTSFLYGQMHVLVLALITSGFYFYRRNRWIVSGMCLAVAAALKVYPLLYGLYLLRKRQWRCLTVLLGATLTVQVLCYLVFGASTMHTYLYQVLPRSFRGEVLDPYNAQASSGSAFFHRMLLREPDLNPHPLLHSPLSYEILYPLWQAVLLAPLLCLVSRRSDSLSRDNLEWAAFTAVILVLSPVPASYHFVVLIFSVVLAVDALAAAERSAKMVMVALFVLVCNIDAIVPRAGPTFSLLTLATFSRLWLGMGMCLFFFLLLWKYRGRQELRRTRAGFLLAATLLSTAIWIVGFVTWRRHFAGLYADSARRIQLPFASYLITDPHAARDCLVTTAMQATGYRVLGKGCPPLAESSSELPDELSSAIDSNASTLWIEVAGTFGSELVQQSLRASPGVLETTIPPIPNAESPALSADGKWLVFLRERQGRGSLWITAVESHSTGTGENVKAELLVPDSFDVRDAGFTPSGAIVFAAKSGAKTEIFKLVPPGPPVRLIFEPGAVRSPAVSMDDEEIAFTELIHEHWQVVRVNLATQERRQLTFADCNAYAPTWKDERTILYATDCGRGMGLTALAYLPVDH